MASRRVLLVIAPLLLAVAIVIPARQPASAGTAASPEAFIDNLAQAALKTIANKTSSDDRDAAFKVLLDANFDVARISRFVLGRYWNSASDADKQRYLPLFESYVVRAYSNRFSDYTGETVKVLGSRAQGDFVIVSSQIVQPNGAPPIKVDWFVRQNGSDFRIADVSVDGVSMVLTEKQQFASVMERDGKGVAGLNDVLAAKLAGKETALK